MAVEVNLNLMLRTQCTLRFSANAISTAFIETIKRAWKKRYLSKQ